MTHPKSIRGQSLTGLLVSSVIGIIVLLGVTDVLNHLTRTQRGGEMSMEFTMWKTTLAGLIKSPDQCSAALSGSPTEAWAAGTAGACITSNVAVVSWPAGCSNPIYTNSTDCVANGSTWTGKVWLKKPATATGRGLEVSSLCIKRGVENGTELGNGKNWDEKVYNSVILLEASKQAEQMGSSSLQAQLYVTLVINSTSGNVVRCETTHDKWVPTSTTGVPQRRSLQAAVWTGSKMMIWGGKFGGIYQNTGGLYDPTSDSWVATSLTGIQITDRVSHSMVWTGSLVLIFGGWRPNVALGDGAKFDPVLNSWPGTCSTGTWNTSSLCTGNGGTWTPGSLISTFNNPGARRLHTTIWTGAQMVIWGGMDSANAPVNTGAQYEPVRDRWTQISVGAATPSARYQHTAVWTGSKMLVFGGTGAVVAPLATGGQYDPLTNTWTAMAAASAARRLHSAIWADTQMIVFGGDSTSGASNTGERYTPGAPGSWVATSVTNPPAARVSHHAVWTGTRMLIWGGNENIGGSYDPATDKWSAMTILNQPDTTFDSTAVWTGSQMIIWGGDTGPGLDTGGRYTPP